MSADPWCQSDCGEAPQKRVLAISGSGRVWSQSVCGPEDHLAGALAVVKELGFTIKSIEDI